MLLLMKDGGVVHWTLIGRLIFPENVFVFPDGVGDKQRYELVSSGPHVLFGAEQPQSAAVMKSPGADPTLREEVLVYACLTWPPPPFFRLPDPRVDVVLLRPKWVKLCLILFILNIIYRLKTVTGIMVTNLNDVTFSFIHSENYDINADVSTALSSFKRLHNVGWRNE